MSTFMYHQKHNGYNIEIEYTWYFRLMTIISLFCIRSIQMMCVYLRANLVILEQTSRLTKVFLAYATTSSDRVANHSKVPLWFSNTCCLIIYVALINIILSLVATCCMQSVDDEYTVQPFFNFISIIVLQLTKISLVIMQQILKK